MIVCDTGPLVALSNEKDEHYFTANNLFRDLFMAGETLVLPATVLAETCYWQFSSFPLGGTDASVVAVAERLGAQEIATLDRRHFPSITPKAGGHFTLLPETL